MICPWCYLAGGLHQKWCSKHDGKPALAARISRLLDEELDRGRGIENDSLEQRLARGEQVKLNE